MPRLTSTRSEPRTVWVGAPSEMLALTWHHSLIDHCLVSQNISDRSICIYSKDLIPLLLLFLSTHHPRYSYCGCRGWRWVWQLLDVQQWSAEVPNWLQDSQCLWWWWVPRNKTTLWQITWSVLELFLEPLGLERLALSLPAFLISNSAVKHISKQHQVVVVVWFDGEGM